MPFEIKNEEWPQRGSTGLNLFKESITEAHAYPIHQVFMVSWGPPFFLPVESEGENYWEICINL